MAIFRIDVKAAATLYVQADDEESAIEKAIDYAGTELCREGDDLLDDYDMRAEGVLISPAFTFSGRFDDDCERMDEQEEAELLPYFEREQ